MSEQSRTDDPGPTPVKAKGNVHGAVKPSARLPEAKVSHQPRADEQAQALLLSGRPPETLLPLLLDGDPLRLVERSAVRLRQRALIMDCERVADRAACAALAVPLTREPAFEEWVVARIDEAIEDLLEFDCERLRRGGGDGGADYEFMLSLFNVPDERSLRAAVQFNTLPHLTRKRFMLLVMEHWSVAECLEAGYGPLEELKIGARMGVAAILGCVPARVDLPKEAREFS
jgi:hypothetical protein